MGFLRSAAIFVLAMGITFQTALSQTTGDPGTGSAAPQGSGNPPQSGNGGSGGRGTAAPKDENTPLGASSITADSVAQQVKNVKAIRDALNADSDLDFSLVLGIGSLVVVSGSTDYSDQSNVIHSNNLGKATPQFLAGVAFRSHLPNIIPRYHRCTWQTASSLAAAAGAAAGNPAPASAAAPAGSAPAGRQVSSAAGTPGTATPETKKVRPPGGACSYAEPWEKRPWNAFVSVKFAPGSSQTINGFVVGASYSLTKYLSALVGFSLTPINEPAPGFRTTAAQFVIAQQKLGQYMNFDPNAMLANSRNAFDGFPVTDPNGKLLYSGNPLTVHYHGGAVFGVSIPIYFSSAFK